MSERPLILAVETSGRTGSVALGSGSDLLGERVFSAVMRHSAELFDAMNELLVRFGRRAEDVERVYVSIGPGSFTGLRIAVTFAKIMSLAKGVKIVAVDTLDVIASNTGDCTEKEGGLVKRTAVVLDAKRGRFFVAVYEKEKEQPVRISPDCLMSAEEFVEKFGGVKDEPIWLLGEGLVYHKDKFRTEGTRFFDESYWWPRASKVHRLGWHKELGGQFSDAPSLQPAYLQRPDIKVKSQK